MKNGVCPKCNSSEVMREQMWFPKVVVTAPIPSPYRSGDMLPWTIMYVLSAVMLRVI